MLEQWYEWYIQPIDLMIPNDIFQFFRLFSNKRCGNEEIFFKWCVYRKSLFLKLDLFFFLNPILLYDILEDMIRLINADTMFTIYDGDIEDI